MALLEQHSRFVEHVRGFGDGHRRPARARRGLDGALAHHRSRHALRSFRIPLRFGSDADRLVSGSHWWTRAGLGSCQIPSILVSVLSITARCQRPDSAMVRSDTVVGNGPVGRPARATSSRVGSAVSGFPPSELDVHHLIPRKQGGARRPGEPDHALRRLSRCASSGPAGQPGTADARALGATARQARRSPELVPETADELRRCLTALGVTRLREGQLEPILAALRGESLIVIRPTGSGKSLCFQVPRSLVTGRRSSSRH